MTGLLDPVTCCQLTQFTMEKFQTGDMERPTTFVPPAPPSHMFPAPNSGISIKYLHSNKAGDAKHWMNTNNHMNNIHTYISLYTFLFILTKVG